MKIYVASSWRNEHQQRVVELLPCGRSAHAEAGWMAGAGKKTLVYIPEGVTIEPELMYRLFDGIVLNECALICKLSSYININD